MLLRKSQILDNQRKVIQGRKSKRSLSRNNESAANSDCNVF
jgi:hypothetical protein